MNRGALLLAIFLIAAGLSACIKKRDRQAEIDALIQQTIKERLANYRKVRLEQCREKILAEATRQADSIMILEALLSTDSINRPPKPTRPERPEIKLLDDTTPVRPLLPNNDTLPTDSAHTRKNH